MTSPRAIATVPRLFRGARQARVSAIAGTEGAAEVGTERSEKGQLNRGKNRCDATIEQGRPTMSEGKKVRRVEQENNRVRLVAEPGNLAPWMREGGKALLPKQNVAQMIAA